jgi:CTP synthase
MPEQKESMRKRNFGATMRLGEYEAKLKKGTVAYDAYGKADSLIERHRHRYEVNPEYVAELEKSGLVFSAVSPNGKLMEIAELPKSQHPFFLASQFHPEFQSTLFHPNPLFLAFMKACVREKK